MSKFDRISIHITLPYLLYVHEVVSHNLTLFLLHNFVPAISKLKYC